MTQTTVRRYLAKGGFTLLALFFVIPFLFIFYWMFMMSIKTPVQNTAWPPIFWTKPTWVAYQKVLMQTPFLKYTWNSFVIAAISTLVGMGLGVPAAFAVAHWKLNRLAIGILTVRIIPAVSFLVPWYILFVKLHLLDTYTGLALSHLIVNLPLILWLMIGFFEDIPKDLHEAALVDGCTTYGSFWRIILPMTQPGLAATAILSFIFSWNNFMFSVILAGRTAKTLPVAVFSLMTYEEVNWGPLAAASALITLPVLIITLVLQRYIVAGLTRGAVKG